MAEEVMCVVNIVNDVFIFHKSSVCLIGRHSHLCLCHSADEVRHSAFPACQCIVLILFTDTTQPQHFLVLLVEKSRNLLI